MCFKTLFHDVSSMSVDRLSRCQAYLFGDWDCRFYNDHRSFFSFNMFYEDNCFSAEMYFYPIRRP